MSSRLQEFWKTQQPNKTTYERYLDNNSPTEILNFIKLGGGPALGSKSEKLAAFMFPCLEKRIDSGHDHTIKKNDKIYKVEQKTSSINKNNDFKFQHIAPNYDWDILLFTAIYYNKIIFYGMNRNTYELLVNDNKITIQGKCGKSDQGMWCDLSKVKNKIKIINSNEDLLSLIN